MTSKIPPRLTYSGIDAPLYVPMDGEGNATVPHKLTTENLEVTGSSAFDGVVSMLGNLTVDAGITSTTITATAGINTSGNCNINGNCIVAAPGIFVGNGQGLTNLPPSNIGLQPAFYFQSQLEDFLPGANYFIPEDEENPAVVLTIPCEMYGKAPGLYYWKTDANILLQNLWDSASGLVYWDGTKVSGETTWSLVQYTSIDNPLYFLTFSELSIDSLTRFNVVMNCSYPTFPVDPAQYDHYYVNFFKIADLGGSATPLPTPTGLAVSDIGSTTATLTWDYVEPYNYTIYNQGPAGPPTIISAGSVGSYDLTGLTAGKDYTVQIQASYFNGSQSQVSARSAAVPYTTPPT